MRSILLLVACLPSTFLLADEPTVPITVAEAMKKVDQKVLVQMEVKSSGGGNTARYLNSLPDYKDRNNFTIYIPRTLLPEFKKKNIDDPAEFYKGKTIHVTGTVTLFRGQAQIKVDDPAQIKLADPAGATESQSGKNQKPK